MFVFCFAILAVLKVLAIHGKMLSCGGLDPLELCDFEISKVNIPFDEYRLVKLCEKLQSYYRCVEEHSEDFPPDDHEFCGYGLLLKKAEPLVKELCTTNTYYYTSYLKHATCFNNMQFYYDECEEVARKMAHLYFKVAKDQKFAQSIKSCLSGSQLIHKVGNTILDTCGPDAMEFYSELVTQSHFYLLYCNSEEEYERALEAVHDTLEGIVRGTIKKKDIDFETELAERKNELQA